MTKGEIAIPWPALAQNLQIHESFSHQAASLDLQSALTPCERDQKLVTAAAGSSIQKQICPSSGLRYFLDSLVLN